MGEIVRMISRDGCVMAAAVSGADIVARAREIHHTSPTATAALGRCLLGCALMGNQLKSEDNSLTLQIRGDGPIGSITCVSDSFGNVRGFAANPAADAPRKAEGHLDVGAVVGREGSLTVIRDLGLKDPYVGSVKLTSGEIAEDITAYFAESEQIPTACALGVLVRKDDGSVLAAGGYLIQLLPGAGEDVIDKAERGIQKAGYVTGRLSEGVGPEELLKEVLSEFELEVLETTPVEYRCGCSRDRVIRALVSMGRDELGSLIQDQDGAELTCQFCDAVYEFTKEELQEIYRSMEEDLPE